MIPTTRARAEIGTLAIADGNSQRPRNISEQPWSWTPRWPKCAWGSALPGKSRDSWLKPRVVFATPCGLTRA